MPLVILNQLQGIKIEQNPYETAQPLACRYQLCHSLGTSLFASSKDSSKLHSDDQAIGGVSQAGYPFLLLIDGFFGCDREAVFAFVESEILPLLEPYTTQLTSNPKRFDVSTQALIRRIFERKRAFLNRGIDFTLSLAVTFALDNGLYVAGFGVGDIGMVLRGRTGRIHQLAYHTVVDGFKDGFDDYIVNHPQKIDEVIQRSSRFMLPVESGDELLAYTYLPASLETEDAAPSAQTGIKRLILDAQFLPVNPNLSLLTQLWEKVRSEHQQQLLSQQATEPFYKFGDDATFIAIQIPTDNQRHSILLANFTQELQAYEKRLHENTACVKSHRYFWHALSRGQTTSEQTILTHVLAILNGEPKTTPLTKDEVKWLEKTALGKIITTYRDYGIRLEHLHARLQQLYTHSPLLWPEITAQVMSYLPPTDIIQAGMTCRFFQHMSQETLQRHYYPKPKQLELTNKARDYMRAAAVNSDCIVIGSTNGMLELWDVTESKPIKTHSLNSPIWSITATNNRWVATISRGHVVHNRAINYTGPYALSVWDIEQNQVRVLLQTADKMTLIANAPDGKAMVATERMVMSWDMATGQCEQQWPITLSISPTIHFNFDLLLAGTLHRMISAQELIAAQGNHIVLWNLVTGESKSWPVHAKNAVSTLVAINQHTCASTAGDNFIKIWDIQTTRCLSSLPHGKTVTAMALLDTAHLLSAEGHGNKKTIKIWDIATGTCVKTLSFYGYTYGFTTTNPQQFVSIDLYSMMDSSSANLWTFSSSPQHNLAVPQQAPPTMKR